MDKLLAAIGNTTTLAALASTLIPLLQKSPPATLKSLSTAEQDPLLLLDPALHSAAYLYIILARLESSDADLHHLFPLLSQFILTFDPVQLRLVPDPVTNLVKLIIAITNSIEQPHLAIHWVGTLANRLTAAALSTHHVAFIHVCPSFPPLSQPTHSRFHPLVDNRNQILSSRNTLPQRSAQPRHRLLRMHILPLLLSIHSSPPFAA